MSCQKQASLYNAYHKQESLANIDQHGYIRNDYIHRERGNLH